MHELRNYRKATIDDLAKIITLLADDELGVLREVVPSPPQEIHKKYVEAFHKINEDSHQYLMLVEEDHEIIGTCHLTLIPSLTMKGSTRLQIEAVRIQHDHRGYGIGQEMFQHIFHDAQIHDASILQLTTDKKRPGAKLFYESLGFQASHEGMKYFMTS